MIKFIQFALFLSLLTLPAEAAPKWLKRTANIAVYVAPLATSALATYGGHICRERNGVEPCTAHYGAFAATEGVRFGVSLTFSGMSMWGHKNGLREWFVPAVGDSVFNSYWAIHESRIHELREKRKD